MKPIMTTKEVAVIIVHEIGGITGTTEFVANVVNPERFELELAATMSTKWSVATLSGVTVAWDDD